MKIKYFVKTPMIGAALFALIFIAPDRGRAQTKADFGEMRAQIQALKQKTEQLENRLAVAEARPILKTTGRSAVESNLPIVQADENGFGMRSADGQFTVKLGSYVQADGRFFSEGDRHDARTDTFLLRRVRPILEGTVFKDYHYFIMPDFGDGKVVIQDAFVEYTHYAEAQLRVGKFREPVGLEMLQSSRDLLFVERGLPTNIVPNRDVGAMLGGQLFKGVLGYQIGVFNGTRDGASSDSDTNDDKDMAGRLWLQPFKLTTIAPLQGLGIGIAGTYGEENGLSAEYKTPAQQPAFHYDAATMADGDRYRVVPQFYYSWGPFGVLGEYALSNSEMRSGTTYAKITNDAWQIAASYVLTGENATYKTVQPTRNFGEGKGIGAVELTARYGELHAGNEAFQLGLADATDSVRSEKSFEVGLNWYLNKNVKAVLDWEHTAFQGGASSGNRDSEDAILTRVQLAL